MFTLIVKRLVQLVPTLFFVSILIFSLQHLLPGDPAQVLAGEEANPEVIAQIRARYHLDQPLPVQYAYWMGGVLSGGLVGDPREPRAARAEPALAMDRAAGQ